MDVSPAAWGATLAGILAVIAVDLVVVSRRPHRPTMRESGSTSRYGGITHQGDTEMRTLLVQAAHGLLRSRADSDLKQWTQGLVARIGKTKAVVALARKLAVVMHTMWVRGEAFRPFREVLDVAA